MAIKNEILDELLKDKDPKTIFSSEGLLGELKKALAERVLNAEMDHHLADSTQDEVFEGEKSGNRRNGYSKKTVLTENEAIDLAIPRDRRGSFEPQLIAKYQRRFPGFDDKIISMYARGMSVREIQGHLRDLYGIEASPQLISTVTDAVLDEVGRWQSRPLDPLYALVFFDALRVKIRDEGLVRNKAVYIAHVPYEDIPGGMSKIGKEERRVCSLICATSADGLTWKVVGDRPANAGGERFELHQE